jgi:hypothetical protein
MWSAKENSKNLGLQCLLERPTVIQGDQIERIFAHWAIVYLGQLFENYRSSLNFRAVFFHGKSYSLTLTQNELGWILGDFFLLKLIWSPWLWIDQLAFSIANFVAWRNRSSSSLKALKQTRILRRRSIYTKHDIRVISCRTTVTTQSGLILIWLDAIIRHVFFV